MISNTSFSDLYAYVVHEVRNIKPGESFIISDLFKGYEWKRIGGGDRRRLGGAFYGWTLGDEGKRLVKATDKTAQNQQKYIGMQAEE